MDPDSPQITYPLTIPQKGLYLIEKFYLGTSIGIVALTIKFKSKIDLVILELAINKTIENNDGIRLRFIEQKGEPRQYIAPYRYKKLDIIDFTGKKLEEVFCWDQEVTQTPFSLLDHDLYYFAMIRLNENQVGCFLKFHHLITDAWTMILITEEILLNYEMIANQNYQPVPRVSYTKFIQSKLDYRNSPQYQSDRQFWHEKYKNYQNLTVLKPRNLDLIASKSSRKTYILPSGLYQKLFQFSKDHKASVFSIFVTLLLTYLYRITGKEELVIGTPILNRSTPDEKKTVGMFTNIVPVAYQMVGQDTLLEMIAKVNKELFSILRHQKYPYEELKKEIYHLTKTSKRLFDIAISYQNSKVNKSITSLDYETRWHFNAYQTESFILHIYDTDDVGVLILNYDFLKDIFTIQEIEILHKRMMFLLEQVLNHPDYRICDYEMVNEEERNLLLYELNNTKVEYPKEKTVVEFFEEQMTKFSDKTAVFYEGNTLTYAELNTKANQIADFLLERSVKPDEVIGVLLNRSIEIAPFYWGILKSGAAYLPIDPEFPKDRINYMLQQSGSKILFTTDKLSQKVDIPIETVLVTDPVLSKGKSTNPPLIAKSQNLAFVIYTSGSTGRPKGVMIRHQSLTNLVFWMINGMGFNSDDRFTKYAGLGFDASVFEFFPALIAGGTLYIIPDEMILDLNCLTQYFETNRITVTFLPTPVAEQFMKINFENLRIMYTGGDKINRFIKRKYTVYNCYGPAENTVVSTWYPIENDCSNIPIGRPIFNFQVYLFDSNMKLVPFEVAGELYIGGDGVSTGYINNPELTSQRFIPHPFELGKILYKTGDLVQWNPDKQLEYLGRIDNQVKIRGIRIELGDIEKQIAGFEGITDTVVIVQEDPEKNKYLCAYIVSPVRIDKNNLKKYLLEKLPGYMMPAFIVQIDKLPLTPNGKVGRKALALTWDHQKVKKELKEPENLVHKKLCEVWEKFLNLPKVGINESFFELGGDSIGAIQLIDTINSEFQCELKYADLFTHSTIEKINAKLETITQKKKNSPLSMTKLREFYLESEGIDTGENGVLYTFPATGQQIEIYQLCHTPNGGETYNMPITLKVSQGIDILQFQSILQKLVDHNEALRTSFIMVDGILYQRVHQQATITIEDRGEKNGELNKILLGLVKSWEFQSPPLMRCFTFIHQNHRYLFLDFQHIICDGVSMTNLIVQIFQIYQNQEERITPYQFIDILARQFENQTILMNKEIEYWKNRLNGVKLDPVLPFDFPIPEKMDYKAESHTLIIDERTTAQLVKINKENQTTTFTVLLTLIHLTIYQLTKKNDQIIATITSGRNQDNDQKIVGCCIKSLLIRSIIDPNQTILEFLKKVKSNIISDYHNQNLSFEDIATAIGYSNTEYFFNIFFIMQNFKMPIFDNNIVDFQYVEFPYYPAQNNLDIQAFKEQYKIRIVFKYDYSLYKKETLIRFSEVLDRICSSFVLNPNIWISDL